MKPVIIYNKYNMEILIAFVFGGLSGYLAQCLVTAAHRRSGHRDKKN